jgi:hypothetical protein
MRYTKGLISTDATLQQLVRSQALFEVYARHCCAGSLYQTEPGAHVTSHAAKVHTCCGCR